MPIAENIVALGLMSGTSLDGLDLAACRFTQNDKNWHFDLLAAETVGYNKEWHKQLSNAWLLHPEELKLLHQTYGDFLGEQAVEFLQKHRLEVDLIASHGHTVFHQPEKGITLQIGDGGSIARMTKTITVCNFRQEDVSKGGQGAPLVPIGDQLLFANYQACINIGGIANLSFDENGKRRSFDIVPANQVLNFLSRKIGQEYDKNGEAASKGRIIPALLDQLDALAYYQMPYPKSLGREWVEMELLPLLNPYTETVPDCLHTFCLHIAKQIAKALEKVPPGEVLVTGGGALNGFLIEKLKEMTTHRIVIPSLELIHFKEAIIFAFLGVLRMRKEINCLASVTGASEDSSAGDIYDPKGMILY